MSGSEGSGVVPPARSGLPEPEFDAPDVLTDAAGGGLHRAVSLAASGDSVGSCSGQEPRSAQPARTRRSPQRRRHRHSARDNRHACDAHNTSPLHAYDLRTRRATDRGGVRTRLTSGEHDADMQEKTALVSLVSVRPLRGVPRSASQETQSHNVVITIVTLV